MKYLDAFPHPVREIENLWIPMSDGVRLAARIWMPENAESVPVPAVLEYIPYCKRVFTREHDTGIHSYFAGHGYACLRVDLRGSGDSEGVLEDEYLKQEQDDGLEILRWIAAQPWCDGRVGMIGISWGGFNGLQIAARQPPELRAVVSLCSTDDRYADDVHFKGGCLLGDNLSWAARMFVLNSMPPDPQIVGERWKEIWLERLEGSGLWLEKWLRHQRRDRYWKHGSICEDYAAIQVPVLLASGWADGYSNAVFRLLKNLQVPRKGLIGPWGHLYPHRGQPGPAIGFLQECLRWWDQWLKGKQTGTMEEPMLRVWMQDSVPPTSHYLTRPGRWVAEPSWPSPHVESREYTLAWREIVAGRGDRREVAEPLCSPLAVGLFAGKWCTFATLPELPHDQRQEDGGALVFDSEPLAEAVEILGAPVVDLELASDRPAAMVAVRLSDVAPDGKATRVTYGLLNLAHRDDHERPQPLMPGRRYRVRVPLNHIAQVLPAGHRVRISISTSYWPLAWPPPAPVQLTVFAGPSGLILPVRPPRDEDLQLPPFQEPESARPSPVSRLRESLDSWQVVRDLEKDVSTLEVVNDAGIYRLEDVDLEVARTTTERYSFRADDFDSVKGEVLHIWSLRRGDWSVRTTTRTLLTSTPDSFRIHAELDASHDDLRIYSETWNRTIPRDHV